MYFVDREEIEEKVAYIDNLLDEAKKHDFSSRIEKLGLERLIHVVIESILDVGNLMIDGFIMRDPGSYHDIIDILIDEKVLPEDDEARYKAIIDLRQSLVQQYTNIDHDQLKETFLKHVDTLSKFSTHIRTYLTNELGVANAFGKKGNE